MHKNMEDTLGFVVIGRNEGKNIVACLESLSAFGLQTVYVDSGSTDGSIELARPLCGYVLPLDPAKPFSAARARNEGFDLLIEKAPRLEYVQFLDGDCTLLPGWPAAALAEFGRRDGLSVAFGHLVERSPDSSVYNRLCALEWKAPAGDITNFDSMIGIMLVRVEVFRRLNGFNAAVVAGEDPEFGARVALAGGIVSKLDIPMATHDADMSRFGQWWKRSVRAGHQIGQRYDLHGASRLRDCAHARKSTMAWGVAIPAAVVISSLIDWRASLTLLLTYGILFLRVFHGRLASGDGVRDAGLYGVFTVTGKIANGWGLLKYFSRRRTGKYRILEYR